MGRTIPRKDADFNVWQDVIATTTETNREKWHIDNDWLNSLFLQAQTAWTTAYEAYLNPASRTTSITFAKNEKREVYEKLLRVLVQMLESNPQVTGDDLHAMGITIRKTHHTPVPTPTTYPEFSVDSSVIRRLGIHFRDQDSKSIAKPHGVHGSEICWAISDTPPQNGVNDLIHSAIDTRTPFILEFEDTQRGKTVWFCLRWENTRGEKGPWSEIVSAIIP